MVKGLRAFVVGARDQLERTDLCHMVHESLAVDDQARILIVDDEPQVRRLLRATLQRLGYHAEEAETGAEALQRAQLEAFDYVITDLKMPGMNGFELARKLGDRGLRTRTAIIGITGGVNIPSDDQASDQHTLFDGYLYKPFKSEQLRTLLADLRR